MSKLKDVAEEAKVLGYGDVNFLSAMSVSQLIFGTVGLLSITGLAAYAVSYGKSRAGLDQMTESVSGTLGEF